MTSRCLSCNIIINEVLAFLQCKMDVMDEKSLIDICATHNTEEEILAAKRLIFDTSKTNKRFINRKQDKARKDLQDILSLLKDCAEPEQLPVFVAQQLHKLPPVNFDHVDVSRLLKDIVHLNQEVRNIKTTHAEEVTSLKLEITNIKASILPVTPCNEDKNTNVSDTPPKVPKKKPKHSCKRTSTPISTTTITNSPKQQRFSSGLPPTTPISETISTNSPEQPRPSPGPPPPRSAKVLFHNNQPGTSTKSTSLPSRDVHKKERNKEEDKGDGFTLVTRKKTWKSKSVNIRGTSHNCISGIKAATSSVAIYASGFDKSVSTQHIEEHLRSIRISVQKVELLPDREGVSHNAFKITINSDNQDKILNDSLWPSGTVVGRFSARAYYLHKKPKRCYHSE
ncbi:hypothetical protein NE865_16338 [Phthorimaea operculella]|nr:hypothetical protein NE865_16338 [Phthorimaea operculella]